MSATLGGKTGTAQVTVVVGPVPRVVRGGGRRTPTRWTGDMTRLSVLGDDDEGEAGLTYTWTRGEPPGGGELQPHRAEQRRQVDAWPPSPARAATTSRWRSKTRRGLSVSSFVTVVVQARAGEALGIPRSGGVVPGGTVQLSYYGQDQAGAEVSPLPAATWSTSGGGTIDCLRACTPPARPRAPSPSPPPWGSRRRRRHGAGAEGGRAASAAEEGLRLHRERRGRGRRRSRCAALLWRCSWRSRRRRGARPRVGRASGRARSRGAARAARFSPALRPLALCSNQLSRRGGARRRRRPPRPGHLRSSRWAR